MSHKHRRPAGRGGALTLAAVLAGSVVLLTAPAAHADTVDVDYQCKTPIGDKAAVSPSSNSGSGNDQLPQTGPADSAVALGTLGGTVLFAGVAGALSLTRRQRPLR